MKILGICGSPIENGNTHAFLEKAFDPIHSEADIEIIQLSGKNISDCVHCNWCLKNKDSAKVCAQQDDAETLLHRIKAADILVLASPAYYGRMTARLAALMDRTRPFIFSEPHRGCMKDKIGVALAVTWGRNTGGETTLHSLIWSFMVLEMLPVSHHHSGALYGAVGIANPLLVGADKKDRQAVTSDVAGILAAQGLLKRAIDLSRRIERTT